MSKLLSFAFFASLVASAFSPCFAQNLDENGALPRATPESVGVDSNVLATTLQQLDEKINRVDGVMILRDGKVIAEAWRAPNGPEIPHALYSLSKSFCSTAVGFAVCEGKLKLDDKLVDAFKDELPENPDPRLKDVTLEHLLTMSCGNDSDPWTPDMIGTDYGLEPILSDEKPTWAQIFLERKIVFDPGATFVYNTTGTYMASAMLQKAVGETARDYLIPRLFDPLHIDVPYWEQSPQGISKGGTGLFLKTEDIAKFGQFLLQKGMWNGKQIMPAEWIENATAKHISNGSDPNNDWTQGYGFQFWRCRYNVYRGDGMYSQFCIVMPDQNAVVAVNSDSGAYQEILNILFENLIPAMKSAEPLPENPDALAKLQDIEKSLKPKEGQSGSGVIERTLFSKALGRDVNYRVYIPNEYRTTSFPYPTLYLLHGLFGNEKNWSEQGEMQRICDQYFMAHPDQKRIVIMPDGGNFWYRDSFDDSCKYETFFFNELIPDVQRRFRCKQDAASRAIAGLSMGGYGATLYALRHPDMFSACYAMSPALFTREDVKKMNDDLFGKYLAGRNDYKPGDERFGEYYDANDQHLLVTKLSDENKKKVRFLIDCGDDDGLLNGACQFFAEARQNGVPCELRVRDGGHTWDYWKTALPIALEFIAQQ